ncbi:rust resistance kinase Lr10-like isoform X2 [Lotus japonicus]|nr:rust resistance kinase Lr10-like isoform X2 [Lotus japonicus]
MMIEFPALPVPVRLLVNYIDCERREILLSDPDHCLPRLFLRHNFSLFYPLRPSSSQSSYNTSFFDCSSVGQHHLRSWVQNSSNAQDMLSCPIYVADPGESVVDLDLFQCTKMFDQVLPLFSDDVRQNSLQLEWPETNFDRGCLRCEHKLKNKSKRRMKMSEHKSKHKIHQSAIFIAAGVVIGLPFLVFLLSVTFRIYRNYRMKGEDHARVEKFLKDYRALKPTRFSYADIKRITNKLKEKLGEGAHGAVYKGKLSTQILVAVKILNNSEGDDGTKFINEVGTMGKIHHVNVVRLLGYCADGFHRALVYDYFPNGSLQNFIVSSPNNKDKKTFLGWEKLQEIALGIAKGIDYLHQGCDQRILHFDINPHNVLLDDTFTPKITDFGLAKLCSKNRSTVSMTAARGTLGYMAPEVFSRNFGNVSYKSDIYSYGMLLLEMVGGRKNIVNNTTGQENNNVQVLYPDWIHGLVEGRDMHVRIDDDEEGDFEIAKKLAIVGLWCIQWHPMHRPSMKTVMQMLHGEGDKLKVPTNPFQPKTSASTSSTSGTIVAKRLNLELEVIQELD